MPCMLEFCLLGARVLRGEEKSTGSNSVSRSMMYVLSPIMSVGGRLSTVRRSLKLSMQKYAGVVE